MHSFLLLLDIIGIAAFAATGALVAAKHNLDVFGALTLAFVTGIGGGTLRDIILGVPVFWLEQAHALWACLGGFLVVYLAHRQSRAVPRAAVNVLDAIGLAVFSVLGAHKAMALDHNAVVCIVMGFLTGCGGGMLRDVLANDIPMVLAQKRLYATPSLAGAALFVVAAPWSMPVALILGFAATLGIRIGSLRYNWRLPLFPRGATRL